MFSTILPLRALVSMISVQFAARVDDQLSSTGRNGRLTDGENFAFTASAAFGSKRFNCPSYQVSAPSGLRCSGGACVGIPANRPAGIQDMKRAGETQPEECAFTSAAATGIDAIQAAISDRSEQEGRVAIGRAAARACIRKPHMRIAETVSASQIDVQRQFEGRRRRRECVHAAVSACRCQPEHCCPDHPYPARSPGSRPCRELRCSPGSDGVRSFFRPARREAGACGKSSVPRRQPGLLPFE